MIILGYTLPNPSWNNGIGTSGYLHVHQTMGGDKYTYIKEVTKQVLEFTIEHIPYNIMVNLRDDLITADDLITLTDWEGNNWEGVILTNPIVFTSHKRGQECYPYTDYEMESYLVNLTFEGVIV